MYKRNVEDGGLDGDVTSMSVITEGKEEKCVKLWGNLHMVAVVSSYSNIFSMFYFWVTMSHALLFYVILCN